MKKGFLPVFLLTAGILMSCGKKEDVIVEEPKVYAIDSGEAAESEGDAAEGNEEPVPEGGIVPEAPKAGDGKEESGAAEDAANGHAGASAGYQQAYEEISRQCGQEDGGDLQYNLIDVDGNAVPELAAVKNGYYVSLYTYDNGEVYNLMDHWAYGAMGNAGYEYCPGKNSLRNYNTDYAGAILYTTYMTIGSQHTIDTVAEIVTYNFDDVNENGMPDEEEEGSMGYYSVSYINGAEASDAECASYQAGEYEYIQGVMSEDELRTKLKELQ